MRETGKETELMIGNFCEDKKRGDVGEELFAKHAGHLMENVLMLYKQRGDKSCVEGMDFFGLVIIDAEEGAFDQEDLEICPEGTKKWILKTAEAAVEVKTVSNFLTRNNNHDEESGTVEFELWTSRMKKNLGWLHGMSYPGVHNSDDKKTSRGIYAVPPTSLVYLYCDKKGRPFVSVVFEDFLALKTRLMEICPEIWPEDAGEWRVDEVDWKQQRTLLPCHGENMWHVPFDMISDLATVTMIDADPVLEETKYSCSKALQEKRLAYLKKCAAGRHLDTENTVETMKNVD